MLREFKPTPSVLESDVLLLDDYALLHYVNIQQIYFITSPIKNVTKSYTDCQL